MAKFATKDDTDFLGFALFFVGLMALSNCSAVDRLTARINALESARPIPRVQEPRHGSSHEEEESRRQEWQSQAFSAGARGR